MGNLYVVATPIGNLEDITIRAAKILLNSKVIVAESASKAGILLKYLEMQFPENEKAVHEIISFSEDEELNKIPRVVNLLEQNNVCLISEAGTPLISDPGFLLVRECVRRGINVIPIPGANAITTALSVSGLPSDKFLFLGFPPKQESKRYKMLEGIKKAFEQNVKFRPTLILYESPHRIIATLETIYAVFGNINIVVARELTKIHEEIVRGKAEELTTGKIKVTQKGEFTILFN